MADTSILTPQPPATSNSMTNMTNWYDPSNLPAFDRPPVTEVVMGLEFPPIPELDAFRLARLQSRWEDRYPVIESRAGTPPTPWDLAPVDFNFDINAIPARLWASAGIDGFLIQTQSDRVILNWRNSEGSSVYPGYSAMRTEYHRIWTEFGSFLEALGIAAPQPWQAEFSYINAIPLRSDERTEDIVVLVADPPGGLPGAPEGTGFQVNRHVLRSSTDPFEARIVLAGQAQTNGETMRLAMTVTSRTRLSETDDSFEALDVAHALSSRSFANSITEKKGNEWARTR